MGIGVSLFLIAVGAILTWAVEIDVQGVALETVGVILMAVGAVGLLWSLVVWGPRRRVRSERVEDDQGRGYRRVEHVDEGF
ncbi:MAG: hypothetical protein QOD86_898 [Miltoncostaeaceae bacterium]|jgi:hypothetical protein|nr:hypothetical protein [Miltoncostaeaceae bacterium]